MPIEVALSTALKARCARTFPVFAPPATQRPYVTYQLYGGTPTRYVDGAAPDKRLSFVQINAWDDTHAGALALMRQIEDDLAAAAAFQARPLSEAAVDAEPDLPRYGARQDFEIVASRT